MILGHPYGSGVDWFAFGAIMHLMLIGENSFRGRSHAQVERKVLEHPATYTQFGPVTGDFLARLFCKDQSQRLGEHGDIHKHLFFASINWQELEACKVESPVTTKQGSLESSTRQRIQVPYSDIWKEPIPEMFQQVFNSVPFVCSAWTENYCNAPYASRHFTNIASIVQICGLQYLHLLLSTTSIRFRIRAAMTSQTSEDAKRTKQHLSSSFLLTWPKVTIICDSTLVNPTNLLGGYKTDLPCCTCKYVACS
ncbi:protein kinase C delta type-like isoform X2 [Hyla sarda]|uniref:protein kinase C delta type-like isoform X2 n=1 Tax=Hyla sarda TaxID=327740 RepID=UPI0024C4372D|nr:protein kinase C delta type-like isoform X2 [Hyla sarda]